MKSRAAGERRARGDLRAERARPAQPVPSQVERVQPPVPGAEVVDAVADDRRRLDRRADVRSASDAAGRAVEHVHLAVHRVEDDARRRRRRATTPSSRRRVVPPDHLPEAHRDRADRRARVADVRDAVVDDGRELDQRRRCRALQTVPERRPQPDVRLRLRARRRRAVQRPLQLGPVDADRRLAASCRTPRGRVRVEKPLARTVDVQRRAGSGRRISATPSRAVRARRSPELDERAARRGRSRSPSTIVSFEPHAGCELAAPAWCGAAPEPAAAAARTRARPPLRPRAQPASDAGPLDRRPAVAALPRTAPTYRLGPADSTSSPKKRRHVEARAEVAEPRLGPLALREGERELRDSGCRPRSAAGRRRRSAG